MIDGRPRFGGEIEEEWLRSTDIDALLASLGPSPVVNLVGNAAPDLRRRLLERSPGRRVRAIDISDGERPGGAEDDVLQVRAEALAESLLARSRTVILDPLIGSWLVGQPALLGGVAARTFESVVLPLFVEPEPYHLYFSDVFSFEEPTGDDGRTNRWCWAIREGKAIVFVQTAEPIAGRRLAFNLQSGNPGTYVCRLGDETQSFTATADDKTRRFQFVAPASETLSRIEISFDGEPFRPTGTGEQRKALYFCFSGFELEMSPAERVTVGTIHPPQPFTLVPERAVRRALHLNGFFEVLTLESAWKPWSRQAGIRSCYDYQAGFVVRDLWEGARATVQTSPPLRYGLPALWMEARRTPSPGSEWISSDERLMAVGTGAIA